MPQPAAAPRFREERKFGVAVGGALLILAFGAWLRGRPLGCAFLAVPGAVLFLAGWVVPSRLGSLLSAWMAMARAISRVTTPLILGVVYFGVVTPTGLLLRWLGKDPLAHAKSETAAWVERGAPRGATTDMERQF